MVMTDPADLGVLEDPHVIPGGLFGLAIEPQARNDLADAGHNFSPRGVLEERVEWSGSTLVAVCWDTDGAGPAPTFRRVNGFTSISLVPYAARRLLPSGRARRGPPGAARGRHPHRLGAGLG